MQKSLFFAVLFFTLAACTNSVIKGCEEQPFSEEKSSSTKVVSLKELCMRKVIKLFNEYQDTQSFMTVPNDLATEIVPRCDYMECLYNKKRKAEIAKLLPELTSAKRVAISAKIVHINNRETAISTIDQNQTVEDWCQIHYGKDQLHIIRRFNPTDSTLQAFKLLSPKTQKCALVLASEIHYIQRNRQPQHIQFYKGNVAQLENLSPAKKNPFVKQLINAAKKEIPLKKKTSRRLFQ